MQAAAETWHGFKVFDTKSGGELYTFMEPVEYKNSNGKMEVQHLWVIYSPDGKCILCPVLNEIKLFDSKTGREVQTLKEEQTQNFTSAVFSPDGNYVAAISGKSRIRIWDVKTGNQLLNMDDVEGSFLIYSRDGATLGCFGPGYSSTYNAKTGEAGTGNIMDYFPLRHDARPLGSLFILEWNEQVGYNRRDGEKGICQYVENNTFH
jgi:WD40 repeat protein